MSLQDNLILTSEMSVKTSALQGISRVTPRCWTMHITHSQINATRRKNNTRRFAREILCLCRRQGR